MFEKGMRVDALAKCLCICVYSSRQIPMVAPKSLETGSCVLRNETAAAFDSLPFRDQHRFCPIFSSIRFTKLRVQNMKESHLLRLELCKVYGTRNAGWN